MKKSILILLLLWSLPSFAQDFEYNGLLYSILDEETKTCKIIGYNKGSASDILTGEFIFPEIAEYNNINYTVTEITQHSFENCSTLVNVTIPNSVNILGACAFQGCSNLTCIKIPQSVQSISCNTFRSCSSLIEINVDEENEWYCSVEGILYSKDKKNILTCPGGYDGAFTIPDFVECVREASFMYTPKLTSVIIGKSVSTINGDAFDHCPNLTEFTVSPDNQKYLSNDGIIYSKDKDTIVLCPNGFSGAFCIPTTVSTIGEYAFSTCANLTSIEIPESVEIIGSFAFSECTSLTKVIIPNSVTSISVCAFESCVKLQSAFVGWGVEKMYSNTFGYIPNAKIILGNPNISIIPQFSSRHPTYYTYGYTAQQISDLISNGTMADGRLEIALSPIFNYDNDNVLVIGANSRTELAPALHSFGPANGIQFDLTLPQGLALSDISATPATKASTDIAVSHAKLENGDFRVLIYANDGEELGDIMLGMSFESDATLQRGTVLCHNIMHSIFDTEVTLADETAFVTGYDVNLPTLTIEELETFTLPAPLSATFDGVTYRWGEIEPVDVATLSSQGIIKAINPGEAVYSLYVKDGEHSEIKFTSMLEVIAALWGDADKDGSVNISDLVAVVNYILERSPENFDTRLADIDHNGRINIVDLTGIVKILLSQKKDEAAQTQSDFSARQELSFGEIETLADNRHHIALEIEPTDDYTAMQTDIRLPEGVTLEALNLGEGLGSHSIDYAEVDESTVRVIIYSPSLAGISSGNKIAVADLVLSGKLSKDAIISAGETLACDTDGNAYSIASTEKGMGETTALTTIKSDEYKAVAVQGGIDLIAPEATPVRINDLSGRSAADVVAPTTVNLAAGVYLVTFDNTPTQKVIVK